MLGERDARHNTVSSADQSTTRVARRACVTGWIAAAPGLCWPLAGERRRPGVPVTLVLAADRAQCCARPRRHRAQQIAVVSPGMTHTGNGHNDERERYIRELVDAAPPLTASQIARLHTLFDREPPEPPTA